MTVEFWRNAEIFYEAWFFILTILLILLVIVLIFVLAYTRKEKRLKYSLIVIGISAVLLAIGLHNHFEYYPYLEQAGYTNPLTRDRTPKLHTYNYYGETEQAIYNQLNYIDSLRKMVIYEEEEIIEPLVYLGRGEHTHYFERADGEYFRHNRQIKFTETAEQAQLRGGLFVLKDDAFTEIGFKNPVNKMYDYIEIPVAEQEKRYQPEDESLFQRAENVIFDWNFRQ